MKRYLYAFSLIIVGFVGHKLATEISNYTHVARFERCRKEKSNPITDFSPWQLCRHHLELGPIEALIMYQPNLYDRILFRGLK